MKKLLAHIGLAKKTCSACKHFDLAAGQQGIATAAPAFVAAAQHLTPEQIASTAMTATERDAERAHILATEAAIDEGKTPPPLPEVLLEVQARSKKAPANVPWKVSEFGACAKNPETAVWQGDSCKLWA